jgi:hypothetical protein
MAPASVHRDDVEFLRRRCGELGEAYAGLSFELPEGPIHGDAHPGATVTPAGQQELRGLLGAMFMRSDLLERIEVAESADD